MEALPGGTALFARAYQAQLAAQGKGGGLTGQAAIEKLRADMQKGLVSSEILRYAGLDASAQANKGGALVLASTASQAEQARYQNAVSDLAVVASNAGVEEGFARIFRTLNAGLSESNGLVSALAEGFNDATKFADDLLLFPQDFVRALEGRDSLVADWFGVEDTRQLQADWKEIKKTFEEIMAIESPSWLPTLESTAQELRMLLRQIAELSSWKNQLLESTADSAPEYSFLKNPITATYQTVGRIVNGYKDSVDKTGYRRAKVLEREEALNDIRSPFYKDPDGYDQMERDRAAAVPDETPGRRIRQTAVEIEDQNQQAMLAMLQDVQLSKAASVNNQIAITLNIDPLTLGKLDIQAQAYDLTQTIATNLEQLLVFFPNTE